MITDFGVGPLKIRLEILPIVVGVGFVSGPAMGISLLLAILVHEAGHFFVARRSGSQAPLTLQVTGGGSYLRDLSSTRAQMMVLLAGPVSSAALAFVAITIAAAIQDESVRSFVADLFYAATVWTVYQTLPFPPLDGGQILRRLLTARGIGATFAWRLGWVIGILIVIGLVALDSSNLQPAVLLTGMAVILGRGESGYVRHLDAYAAWERGDHRAVLTFVKKIPEYVDREDRARLTELGLFAARELNDANAVEELLREMSVQRPVVVTMAEWLLARGDASGARIAQRALDAVDADHLKFNSAEERERMGDLVFRYAVFEASELRLDSALGLLDRAIDLGFSDLDRIEADGALKPVLELPRWQKVRARLSG